MLSTISDKNREIVKNYIVALIFIAGSFHLAYSAYFRSVGDIIFSICLMVNTLLMIRVLKIVKAKMAEENELYEVKAIFNFNHMLFFGLGWGIFLGISPFIIPFKPDIFKPDTIPLAFQISMAIYLFLHNFLTGMCILPLLIFFIKLFRNQEKHQVELWDRSNSEFKTHLKIFENLIIYVTLICSLAIIAAFLSSFDIEKYVCIFSIICAAFMLAVYWIPQYPIIKTLKKQRFEKLEEINKLIQIEFDAHLSDIVNGDGLRIKRIEKLQLLKSIVTETSRHFSTIDKITWSVVRAIAISSLPMIIQYISSIIH